MKKDATSETQTSPKKRKNFLLRSESLVASLGLAFVLLLTVTLSAAVFWTAEKQKDENSHTRSQHIEQISNVLAQSIEGMLASDDYTSVRRIVADTARTLKLTSCKVTLPDGQTLADAEPSRINLKSLPTTWPQNNVPQTPQIQQTKTSLTAQYPLIVPGKGKLILHVGASMLETSTVSWELLSGIGAIGAFAMLATLFIYRKVRKRTHAMSTIREALLALSQGETEQALHPL